MPQWKVWSISWDLKIYLKTVALVTVGSTLVFLDILAKLIYIHFSGLTCFLSLLYIFYASLGILLVTSYCCSCHGEGGQSSFPACPLQPKTSQWTLLLDTLCNWLWKSNRSILNSGEVVTYTWYWTCKGSEEHHPYDYQVCLKMDCLVLSASSSGGPTYSGRARPIFTCTHLMTATHSLSLSHAHILSYAFLLSHSILQWINNTLKSY